MEYEIIENRRKIYIKLEGENKFLKVSLDYEKGGMNYFHGGTDARGIKLHFTQIERIKRDGYNMETFYVGCSTNGFKAVVKRTKRLNTKQLNKYFLAVVNHKEELKCLYLNQDQNKLFKFIAILNQEVK